MSVQIQEKFHSNVRPASGEASFYCPSGFREASFYCPSGFRGGFILPLIYIIRKVRKRQGAYPSLVMHGLRFKKNMQKGTLAFKGGDETQKIINFYCFLSFTVAFFFPERLHCCYIDFHCSYLYSYYNSSRTLCIKCWDSAFRTLFQHFILRYHQKRG